MKNKILAIIPARKNSKRIKNKNLKKLNGKPLIFYTIKHALESKIINRIIVSTDSLSIKKYSNKFGNIAPFIRPKNLAGDKVSDEPVIKHACDWVEKNENYFPNIVIILRPTAPLRNKYLISNCVKKLIKNTATSVRSARDIGHAHPYWMYKIKKDGSIKEFIKGKNFFKYYQSQKLPKLVKHDGYCDVLLRKNLINKKTSSKSLANLYGKKMFYEINDDKYFINIDEPEDFNLASLIIKSKND